ncbi:TetR/AcrR family transcriptional regulator [Micromonospora sp. NBC_01655]|uniref:TetR/AcrR family transcriptional regulator n=1 Tax=Micromonospora sp. NBC_01655 TaxID=2975983 RepID=UPI00225276E2|nr:TetR/AcrR family transcriptional regulator [Micromonospora sp. NBC_01655]MCX4472380.1 TetR/AcrR family transcriptional regulator [Micromonospora sp. NBC_01655]
MVALVDEVVDGWERELTGRLHVPLSEASPQDRLRSYLDWSLSGTFDVADLVMLTDPRLRDRLTARWAERLGPWLEIPDALPSAMRGRLTSVRLIADGAWFADATGTFPLSPDERARVRVVADRLLGH